MLNDQNTATPVSSLLQRLAGARVLILFLLHVFIFTTCYTFAWLLRFEFSIPAQWMDVFQWSMPVVVGTQLLAGAFFSFYRGWWRYVGIADVIRLVAGLTIAVTLLIGIWYVGGILGVDPRFITTPRGVLLIDWAFALLTLFGARVIIRVGRDRLREAPVTPSNLQRVIIVGAGDAGETLAREIEHRPQLGMKVVAFVDDQRAKWGSHIRGIQVYGPIANIATLADDMQVDEALIAIPSASGKRMREIIHDLSEADLRFKTIPGIDHLVSGKVHVSQLRPVNVEDLLRRQRIDLPGDTVRALFKGRRVMITGAGGTIGSELASQILQFEPEALTLIERSEYLLYESEKRLRKEAAWLAPRITCNLADIQDREIIEHIIATHRPEVVLHAAAHKHVPLGEQNPSEYVRNNALATRDLAELCRARGVERFVFISTDKAINPTSVMGATKRAAEILLIDSLRDTKMKLTIVRFGNVIGSSGSAIPLFIEQIAAGGPVTVTHPEVTRYFLRTSEAVSLVLQAAAVGEGGNVFMLDMGEPVKIADLARDLIRLSNHTEDEIPVVFTGLRPGEKLFEEVRLQGESIKPTVHPQIVVTEPPQPPRHTIAQWVAAAEGDPLAAREAVIASLATLIPEYILPEGFPAQVAAVAPPIAANTLVTSA